MHALDGFIVIGGEGTMGTTAAMADVPVIGIPKTIDNDIGGTDASIGFWTAAQIATDSIDRLYSTAESHNRVMVCEVMGRSAGWIGITAGLAGGADVIVIPEHPFDIEAVCRRIRTGPFGTPAVLDRGGLGGRHAGAGHDGAAGVRARRERLAAPGRHRAAGGR